jgi:carbon storage regulator CsrA
MLVLSRKTRESIVISDSSSLHGNVQVSVIEIRGGRVCLGIDAHPDVRIDRHEVHERICIERRAALVG